MYRTTLNTSAATTAATVAFGAIAFAGIIALAVLVLRIIARWKIFEKAGEKGWKALIPFYNDYIFYKIIDMVPFFWALLISGIVISCLSAATGSMNMMIASSADNLAAYSVASANPLVGFLSFAVGVFSLVTAIIAAIRLAKVFGKGGGYIAGLILVPEIFLMILGFGKAKYNKKALKK